jgi:hypothetical protein
MPAGIGYGMGGSPQRAPSDPTGIAQPMQSVPMNPGDEAMGEIVRMLRGGQVSAEKFVQLLSLLAGSTLGQQQPQQQAPAATPQQQASIAQLLGG